MSNKPFIFISYARRDSRLIYPEIRRLRYNGYELWYDRADIRPGRNWADETDKAIRECSCFVVFMTPGAALSKYVGYEINQALEAGKPFIRIDWEKIDLAPQIQQRISQIQSLERYLLHQSEYEEQLRRSLSEYVGQLARGASDESPTGLHGGAPRPISPLLAPAIFLLAMLTAVVPRFAPATFGGPASNTLAALLVFFSVVLSTATFVINLKHLLGRPVHISPREWRARVVVFLCYVVAVLALIMGAFFAVAAALEETLPPEFDGIPRPLTVALVVAPFLVFATLLTLLGRRVQTLFARRHPPRKIRDLMAVGCLRLGSLGCGLWGVLSICTVLVTGKLVTTGERVGLRDLFVGSSGFFLSISLMLATAWFISETSLHIKAEKRRRAYRAYQDALRSHLHRMAEPETRIFVQELTMEVLKKLDATLKSDLLIFLGESGLLEGNVRIVLDGTDFRYVNLASNSLPRSTLRGINLGQATLEGCILFEADLRSADLSNAELSYANLHGANLRRTDLTGAELEQTNLHGADLTEAKVTPYQLTQARLQNTILPDGTFITSDSPTAELPESLQAANGPPPR